MPENTSVAVEVIARRSPPATRRTVTTATAPSSYLERLCGCSGTDDGAVAGAPTSRAGGDRRRARSTISRLVAGARRNCCARAAAGWLHSAGGSTSWFPGQLEDVGVIDPPR